MSELKYQIVKHLGTLGDGKDGWRREVNLVSWNERKPKLDIREWDEAHSRMKKGLTFNESEMRELANILSGLDEKAII